MMNKLEKSFLRGLPNKFQGRATTEMDDTVSVEVDAFTLRFSVCPDCFSIHAIRVAHERQGVGTTVVESIRHFCQENDILEIVAIDVSDTAIPFWTGLDFLESDQDYRCVA